MEQPAVNRESFRFDGDVLQTGLRGAMTTRSWSDLLVKTLAMAGIFRTRNLLIDLTQTVPSSEQHCPDTLPAALEYIFQSGFYRLAIVTGNQSSAHTFLEGIFSNRDFRLRMFACFAEARSWLDLPGRVRACEVPAYEQPAGMIA